MTKETIKYSKRIRHISCLDIDLLILSTNEVIDGLRANVIYYNRHYKMFQGKSEIVMIKERDYWKWKTV